MARSVTLEAGSGTRRLLLLVAVAVGLRAVPLLIWPELAPIRDEASYVALAERWLHGDGVVPTSHGWLWAPLYPALLALHKLLFGAFTAIRWTQVLLSALSTALVFRLGTRLGGARVGLMAGWLYALEPTLIAFSHYLWTEHLYALLLLLVIEGTLRARDRTLPASILPGVALGVAVLMRGVGTYALPFLLPALLWGRLTDRRAWARAALLAASVLLVVLPYSVYASRKFGGLVIVDTSVGFNMWLGNNEFEPVSFDYRMGGDTLSEEDYARLGGRKECWQGLPVPEKSACEIKNGLAFIRRHPALFVRRIWTREAQTLNPSSFLLRNLRWGRYPGIPGWIAEAICVLVLLAHFLVVCSAALGGAASAGGRTSSGAAPTREPQPREERGTGSGSGPLRGAVWGLTLYHLAAAGALIGLSRFRVPLLPLWIPFSALLLAHPAETLRRAFGTPRRALFAASLLLLVTSLSLVYLGRAFPAASPHRPRSLLLISVDTLRADHVHAYGYLRPTTPRIDALAAAGVTFRRAWAHSPWTLPSHATMLSGTHPFRHGVVDDGTTIGPEVPLLAPILKRRGYVTAAVVSGFYVSSRFGFQRGFDRFEDFGLAAGLRGRDSVRAEEVTDRALRAIEGAGESPFFVFAHYFDPHNNYDPPSPWNRAFDADTSVVQYRNYDFYRTHPLDPALVDHAVAQYDEEILYADAMIGGLLDGLERRGRREDTLIVLTADHGEEFFEHGSWGHGNSLYAQVLRVPLIFQGPGLPEGTSSDAFVRHEDLAPTLLELLSLPPPPEFEGRSYASLVRNPAVPSSGATIAGPAKDPAAGEGRREGEVGEERKGEGKGRENQAEGGEARLLLAETSRFQTNLIGAVTESRALILDLAEGRSELYDLKSDPEERTNLAAVGTRSVPSEAGGLFEGLLRAALASTPERWVLSWRSGSAGCLRSGGMILGGAFPTFEPAEGVPFSRLAMKDFGGSAGELRFATIPPDAPLEIFLIRPGSKGICGWTADGSARPRADRSGTFSHFDPIGDGVRLRGTPVAVGRGPGVRIRIESGRAPAEPTNLTPEERERLRSLGYVH